MEELKYEKNLFGGKVNFIIYNSKKDDSKKAVEKAFNEGLRLQKIFNFYDDKSELSRLNKKRKLKVSKELFGVIKKAISLSELTNGKYDISIGKKILNRKKGIEVEINCSYKDIKFNGKRIELKNEDVLIDLGSIAKGYITDKMADILKKNKINEFVIDSRGDMLFCGTFNHLVEIEHPRKKDSSIGSFLISDKAVATSGDYNQYTKNFDKSHLINKKNIISATVIADTLEIADLYATALTVSSKKQRKILIEKNPKIKFFLVNKNLRIEKSSGWEEVHAKKH